MQTFNYHNPVEICFGEGIRHNLTNLIRNNYKRILLVCAQGPFHENGLYDTIQHQLEQSGCQVFSMNDISSNPKLSSVYEGIECAQKNDVDCVVALGGGSAMDCAKVIAMSAKTHIDPYEYLWGSRPPVEDSFDTIMIPTIAATGTEMNNTAVIVNEQTREKYWCLCAYPKLVIMDPEITLGIPVKLAVWGAMDILSHTFEYYFNGNFNSEFQLRFSEALILSIMDATERIVQNPDDVTARGELQWCSTVTWGSGLTKIGRGEPDMACHSIEESFSGYFDTHHGACLGILTPRWMKLTAPHATNIFARFARNVMQVKEDDDALASQKGVQNYIKWLKSIHAPQVYSDISSTHSFHDEELLQVAQNAWRIYHGQIGRLYPLSFHDIVELLKAGKEPL